MLASLSRKFPSMRKLTSPTVCPKIVMFFLLIALFYLILNWPCGKENGVRAYVTLNGIERVTLFDKGETVQRLRYLIMQTFSDLGLDGYPAGCVKIMEREDTSGKYTKLPILLTLCRDVVVTVKLPETLLEKERCIYQVSSQLQNAPTQPPGPIAFHPINNKEPYRFWSPVFGGSHFLRRGPNNIVDCNGKFTDSDSIMFSVSTKGSFVFTFKSVPGKKYVLTALNETTLIAKDMTNASPKDITTEMRFIPDYFWSFTLLKNIHYKYMYLACDASGQALLLPMDSFRYPDTRALFIANKYNPVGSNLIA